VGEPRRGVVGVTTIYCAVCRRRFEPDVDHVRVDAEHVRINDRNDEETYAFHPDCWRSLTGEWMDPA